jgi:signal transduction histidine kinase
MVNTLAGLIATLDRIVDYFIPPAIAADRELRQRAHVFLVSHILGPFIGNVVPIALYIVDPSPGYEVAVLALSITAFWVFPFLLKAGVSYNPLALISIQNLIFCILWSCYFYGGVTSPTLPWVLTIPLLAFFYLGSSPRLRIIFIAMFAVNFALFCVFYVISFSTKNELPIDAMQGLGLVSTCAASIYVAMMALYYAKVLASQGELEAEMRGHLSTAVKLRAATEEAERAGAAKAEFLAKMSHELRTPLNAVIGYSQILLEDAQDEGDASSVADLQKIHGAGQHLLRLVSEILDLSKIEAGKMELHNEEADLAALIATAVEANSAVAKSRDNEVKLDLAPDLGTVFLDIGKFRNLFTQIYDNAHKFTERGKVEVQARRNGNELEISVRDSGIGIGADHMERLFEKFTVVDDASNSKYGGTGLGLALAQKLCVIMGGRIEVESAPGDGSCFTICLPAVATVAQMSPESVAGASLVPDVDAGPGIGVREGAFAHG